MKAFSEEELEKISFQVPQKVSFPKTKKLYNNCIRVSKILTCIIILLFSSTTIYAIYHSLQIFIFNQNTDVITTIENPYEVIKEKYVLQVLPDRYDLIEVIGKPDETDFILFIYSNGQSEINLRQQTENTLINFDNENTREKNTLINGNQGIYFTKNQESVIIWEEYNYFYILDTNDAKITEKEMIQMAESLKLEESYEKKQ